MGASDPNHVQLFALLTDGSMRDCSAGPNLLKITGLRCYSATFFFLYLQSFFLVFLSLCLTVDHIRKTSWALEVCAHSPV